MINEDDSSMNEKLNHEDCCLRSEERSVLHRFPSSHRLSGVHGTAKVSNSWKLSSPLPRLQYGRISYRIAGTSIVGLTGPKAKPKFNVYNVARFLDYVALKIGHRTARTRVRLLARRGADHGVKNLEGKIGYRWSWRAITRQSGQRRII